MKTSNNKVKMPLKRTKACLLFVSISNKSELSWLSNDVNPVSRALPTKHIAWFLHVYRVMLCPMTFLNVFTSNAFLLIAHLLLSIILVRTRRHGFQYGVFMCVIVPCSYLCPAPSTLFLSKNMIQRNKAEILFVCCFRIVNCIFLISQLYCPIALFLSSGAQTLLLLHFLSWACWSRLVIPTGRRITQEDHKLAVILGYRAKWYKNNNT